jgi:PiT family inorganic phosphate transporter
MLGMQRIIGDLANEAATYRQLKSVPAKDVPNFRNNMYVVSESLRLMKKSNYPALTADDWGVLDNYKSHIDNITRFIPIWVKVAVALALGMGTMIGWKRIVVTVG